MRFKRYVPAVAAITAWVGSFVLLFFLEERTALLYHFAKFICRQDNIFDYHFSIAVLATYLAISIPAALAGLVVYQVLGRGPPRFTMRSVFVAITAIAIPLGLAVAEDSMIHPIRAALFTVYLLAISASLWWLLHRV